MLSPTNRTNTASKPWLTLSAGALALLIFFLPDALTERLQFTRQGLLDGAFWQLVTGHMTHWNLEHLLADIIVFAVLGSMVESRSRKCFAILFVGSALLISASVFWFLPEIGIYRGLSGIDMALAGFAFLDNLTQSRRKTGWIEPTLWLIALFGLFAKPVIEIALGHPIFVQDLGEGVVGLPAPHFVGAAIGIGSLLLFYRHSRREA